MNESKLGAPSELVKDAPLLTLLTDFGLQDAYVGVMKGVILGICPTARLVDLTHAVPPQNVPAGCLQLEAARPYFPSGTVHLAVVDPGVGTERPAVVVVTTRDILVGPDNGLFSCVSEDEIIGVHRIESAGVPERPVSRTFHGRDLFAPAAARVAAGLPPERLGPPLHGIARLDLPAPTLHGEVLSGQILTFDHFGNAVTNIRREDLPRAPEFVQAAGRRFPFRATYAEVDTGEIVALVGSTGRIELSIRNGNARDTLGLRREGPVTVGP